MEKVGLGMVMEDQGFSSGYNKYMSAMQAMGSQTDATSRQMASAGDVMKGVFGGQMLANAAMGIVDLGKKAVSSFIGIGKEAFGAASAYEKMAMSMGTLVAREVRNQSVVKETIGTITQKIQLTEKEAKELAKLQDAYPKLTAQIAVQAERYDKAAASGKASAAQLNQQAVAMESNKEKAAAMGERIAELTGKQGRLVTTTQEAERFTLSQAEAMDVAAPKTRELLSWIERLAVVSPFSQESVAMAFRQALAYGFTTDEAKRLSQTMIDFASASGQSQDVMARTITNLGQIKAAGKMTGGELRQLAGTGIPVREILAKAFSVTQAELSNMIEKGLVPADKAIEAITQSLETDFAGAAARSGSTLEGLTSSLMDLKSLALREMFMPFFDSIRKYLVAGVELLQNEAIIERLRQFGRAMGDVAAGFLGGVEVIGKAIFKLKDLFIGPPPNIAPYEQGLSSLAAKAPTLGEQIKALADKIAAAIDTLRGRIAAGQEAGGGLGGVLGAMGFSEETITTITGIVDRIGGVADRVGEVFGRIRAKFEEAIGTVQGKIA